MAKTITITTTISKEGIVTTVSQMRGDKLLILSIEALPMQPPHTDNYREMMRKSNEIAWREAHD